MYKVYWFLTSCNSKFSYLVNADETSKSFIANFYFLYYSEKSTKRDKKFDFDVLKNPDFFVFWYYLRKK